MSENTVEDTTGTEQQSKSWIQSNSSDYQQMAANYLRFKRVQATDENVGIVVHFILKAKKVYKPEIGSLEGFISLYMDYAVKTIRTQKNKLKREITVSSFSEKITSSLFDKLSVYDKPRESELFSFIQSKNVLTKTEEDVIYRIYFLNEKEKHIAEAYNCRKQYINKVKFRALSKLQCLKSELV